MRLILLLTITFLLGWGKIGTVSGLRGDVMLQRGGEVLKAAVGSSIDAHDKIVTQARSKVQIMLIDQTVITVGPSSEFSFDKYSYPDDPEAKMSAKRGFFKAVTGKIGKIAPKRFSIKTQSATIGIRGTHFMGYISDTREKIGCLKGEIVVTTPDGEFTVEPGQMLQFDQGRWEVKPLDTQSFKRAQAQSTPTDSLVRETFPPGMDEQIIEEQSVQERVIEEEAIEPEPEQPQNPTGGQEEIPG
jgi:hypothetical protein